MENYWDTFREKMLFQSDVILESDIRSNQKFNEDFLCFTEIYIVLLQSFYVIHVI